MSSVQSMQRRWLASVVRSALRRQGSSRRAYLEERCADEEVRARLETTLALWEAGPKAKADRAPTADAGQEARPDGTEGTVADFLATGGALDGTLLHRLTEALGLGNEDGEEGPGAEWPAGGDTDDGNGPSFRRLRLERLLSTGGMGQVYEAWDELLERRVAVKVRHETTARRREARLRFLREARSLSRLDHPHVCRLYDLVEEQGQEALVLEYVRGEDLRELTAGVADPPGVGESLRIATELAEGLAAAHAVGVVHRDLKPSNVMLTSEGSVKIVDFGISRFLGDGVDAGQAGDSSSFQAPDGLFLTRRGTTPGTLAYMSPEQSRGQEVSTASDVYSLGIVLRELFTRRPSYRCETLPGLWRKVESGDVEAYDELEPPLAALLDDMLRADPALRPSAEEVTHRLREIRRRPIAASRRRRRLATLAGVALLVSLAAAASWWWHRPRPLVVSGEAPRLAVLPFENGSGDEAFDWVESGLTEMVTETLAQVEGLSVVPFEEVAETARQRGGELGDDAEVAEALGATVTLRARVTAPGGEGGEPARLVYRAGRIGGEARERMVVAADLFAASEEMARRLTRRLAPDALRPVLRDVYSGDPLVNRLFATGLQWLHTERAAAAEDFFRVVLRLEPPLLEAQMRLAEALALQSKWDEAESQAQELVRAAGELDRDALVAAGLRILSEASYGRDRRPESLEWARRAVEAAERAGRPDVVAASLKEEGRILRFLDPAAAQEVLQRPLAIYRRLGNRLGEAKVLQILGAIAADAGDAAVAVERLRSVLAISEDLGAIRMEAVARDGLAIQRAYAGDPEGAVELARRAAELHRLAGNRRSLIFTLNDLGDFYHEAEKLEEAEEAFREAEALCAEIEAPNPCALNAFNFGELLLGRGDLEAALPLVERSEAYYGTSDPDLIYLRALVAVLEGDVPKGRRNLARAMEAVDAERAVVYRKPFEELLERQGRSAPPDE